MSDGWFTLSNFISDRLEITCYIFSFSKSHASLYKCFKGNTLRAVYAMKDPHWIFYQEGDILDFENPDYYKKRLIRERLNKDIIVNYCSKLGLKISDDNFWTSNKPGLYFKRIKF